MGPSFQVCAANLAAACGARPNVRLSQPSVKDASHSDSAAERTLKDAQGDPFPSWGSTRMSYEDIREQVAEANRVLAEFGLSSGAVAGHGHASMRVPGSPERFVVKGRGARIDVLARSRPEEMIVC